MRDRKGILAVLFLCFFIIQLSINIPVKAEEQNNIILLIDNSGSMKQTDSNRLSITAASILADSMGTNTSLSIVSFGDRAVSQHKLADKPSAEILKDELLDIKFDNNNTDLREGLKEALNQLEKTDGRKTIIVLSDGMEDPIGGLTKEHMNELNLLVEKAHTENVKINCIGLSQAADKEMLNKISFKTGGDYYFCDSPSQIFDVFSKITGNMEDFYTIENYTTDNKRDKEIKLSSYIEEVVIKVASCDNKTPQVSISQNGVELNAQKFGDTYKIYSFSNKEDRTIKISARNEGRNSVIVQIKSKEKLIINSDEHSFNVPIGVPMDIDMKLQNGESIKGLHMDKLDAESRENINKYGESFKFTFKKEQSGQYPVLVTAYDGQGNIISVRNFDINVTEYPPFYYSNPVPEDIMVDKPFKIELKQQNNAKVNNPSGDIIVDYGGKYDEFPLKYENNSLTTEIIVKNPGNFKLTAAINGVFNNQSFSYYLPYIKCRGIEKPYIELEVLPINRAVKQKDNIELMLNIKDFKIYENIKIGIYDIRDNKLGEFEISPDKTGLITVPVKFVDQGENIILRFRATDDVRVTEAVSTNIEVLSAFKYYSKPLRLPLIIVLAVGVVIIVIILFGKFQFRKLNEYHISKELSYRLHKSALYRSLDITLEISKDIQYLNLRDNEVTVDDESVNEIGSFILKFPKGPDFLLGLKYFIFKEKLFNLEYHPSMYQIVTKYDDEITGSFTYEKDIEIALKVKKDIIRIYFS